MRPADGTRLTWLAPAGLSPERFASLRPRLEQLVTLPQPAQVARVEPVYVAKRRAIYRVEDEILGPVAVKEIRSETWPRRLWFGLGGEHPALHEFRVGSAFEARGGRTPAFLGAAVEGRRLGPERVLLFLRWVDEAETLSDYLRRQGLRPPRELLRRVAGDLLEDARLGLVHGRHSTDNLLVVPDDEGAVDFQPIDFAYSRLGSGLDADGYVADVARVAIYIVLLGLWTHQRVEEFVDETARLAWPDPDEAARAAAGIRARLHGYLRRHFGLVL